MGRETEKKYKSRKENGIGQMIPKHILYLGRAEAGQVFTILQLQ